MNKAVNEFLARQKMLDFFLGGMFISQDGTEVSLRAHYSSQVQGGKTIGVVEVIVPSSAPNMEAYEAYDIGDIGASVTSFHHFYAQVRAFKSGFLYVCCPRGDREDILGYCPMYLNDQLEEIAYAESVINRINSYDSMEQMAEIHAVY